MRFFSSLVLVMAAAAPLRAADSPLATASQKPLALVSEGRLQTSIVLADMATDTEIEAAEKLATYIGKSSGAKVPILRGAKFSAQRDVISIFVGEQRANAEISLKAAELPEETFAIKTGSNSVHLVGKDTIYKANAALTPHGRSPATLWAVNYLAEQCIGVRWLWPGELGTFIPKLKTIHLAPLDVRYTPPLELRAFRASLLPEKVSKLFPEADLKREHAEAFQWMENQQLGDRFRTTIAHAFTHWLPKYGAAHPDFFALPPPGVAQSGARGVKLRLANPAVIDAIAAEYIAAGCPPYWCVAPNDGVGFDTSAETCAWDVPQKQSAEDIWNGRGQLTARYVHFWNSVHARLSALNAKVVLTTLAYSSYRNPPPPGVEVKAPLVVALVPSYTTDLWKGWADAGAKLILRPNWWQGGVDAPYLPLEAEGSFIKFAAKHGMIGFNSDSLLGFWGAQGLRYYVTARLLQGPEQSIETLVEEYASAFGRAKPIMVDYFRYWADFSKEASYPVAAGGVVSVNPQGLYEKLCAEHALPLHPIPGSDAIIPYLYTDEVLAKGRDFLRRAREALRGEEEPGFALRIHFLEGGLDELQALREVLIAAHALKQDKSAAHQKQYTQSSNQLLELRRRLTKEGVIWGDIAYDREIRRGIPTLPEAARAKNQSYDGL